MLTSIGPPMSRIFAMICRSRTVAPLMMMGGAFNRSLSLACSSRPLAGAKIWHRAICAQAGPGTAMDRVRK